MWLKLDRETADRLLALCEEHAPELGKTLLEEAARFEGDPEQPWQDRSAAVERSRRRWRAYSDDLEIDDDAALSTAESGVWVQGWLWVGKDDLEDSVVGGVSDS